MYLCGVPSIEAVRIEDIEPIRIEMDFGPPVREGNLVTLSAVVGGALRDVSLSGQNLYATPVLETWLGVESERTQNCLTLNSRGLHYG